MTKQKSYELVPTSQKQNNHGKQSLRQQYPREPDDKHSWLKSK